MKKILFVLLSVFMINTLAFAKSDTIIIGVENETPKINPLFDEDHDSALDLIFSGLTTHDENMKIVPDLAKSWEISKDRKVYTFELRDDAYWHDGEKFSADDVKFTIQTALDEKLSSPAKANYEPIDKVEVLSPYKIKITLKTPFEPLLSALSIGMLPKHILDGKDLSVDNYNNAPIGTGPYKLVEWNKGKYLKFEAFDKYYGGVAKTKNVYMKFVPDFNVAAMQLQKGELDAALSEPNMAIKLSKNPNLKILKEDSADYRSLMFNMQNELFKDKNVRKALNYAVNKEAIVKNILHGYGSVANNPIEKSWANDENVAKFEYNPQKAIKILQDNGWSKNKNGYFQKDGKELKFGIYAYNTDPLRVSLANILSSDFQKIGINATAYAKPQGSFKISDVDTFLIGWGSPFDPDFHTYRIFGSFADSSVDPNGWNYSHYNDKNVDEALFKARSLAKIEDRKVYYSKFLEAIYENPPFIFIAYLEFPLVYNAKISGIKPHVLGHHGGGFAWNVKDWIKE